MNAIRRSRIPLVVALVALTLAGLVLVVKTTAAQTHTRITAYFENTNGIYPGDQVRILGVPVGRIESIEPQPRRAKVSFWVDRQYKVPANAEAVILAPALVSARYIQLTPAYAGGPALADNAVIPRERTAVPVEFDDLRTQLDKLNQTLRPTEPGGVSTLGALIDTAADNLRGQGPDIRDAVVKLSQTLSVLGDHSGDIFATVKNLAVLVSALQQSIDVTRELNQNLAAVSGLLANDPNEVGKAVSDLNGAVSDIRGFIADNREPLATTSDKLGEISQAIGQSLDDVKQTLHIAPTELSNYVNIYEPAHASITGALAITNFSNPINFICGAIQAASRLNAEQSAKLCVQYLAPIVKNRQYNFPLPIGFGGTPFPVPFPPFMTFPVGAMARPNELTYSEDWLRPDFVPPAAAPANQTAPLPAEAPGAPAPAADTPTPDAVAPPQPTNPSAGLEGMMVPHAGGS